MKKKKFIQKIKPIIDMYFYNDSESVRFLAWIKAKPTNIKRFDKILKSDILFTEEKWKERNEADFNKLKEL